MKKKWMLWLLTPVLCYSVSQQAKEEQVASLEKPSEKETPRASSRPKVTLGSGQKLKSKAEQSNKDLKPQVVQEEQQSEKKATSQPEETYPSKKSPSKPATVKQKQRALSAQQQELLKFKNQKKMAQQAELKAIAIEEQNLIATLEPLPQIPEGAIEDPVVLNMPEMAVEESVIVNIPEPFESDPVIVSLPEPVVEIEPIIVSVPEPAVEPEQVIVQVPETIFEPELNETTPIVQEHAVEESMDDSFVEQPKKNVQKKNMKKGSSHCFARARVMASRKYLAADTQPKGQQNPYIETQEYPKGPPEGTKPGMPHSTEGLRSAPNQPQGNQPGSHPTTPPQGSKSTTPHPTTPSPQGSKPTTPHPATPSPQGSKPTTPHPTTPSPQGSKPTTPASQENKPWVPPSKQGTHSAPASQQPGS